MIQIWHLSSKPKETNNITLCGLVRNKHFKHFKVLHGVTRLWDDSDAVCKKCERIKNKLNNTNNEINKTKL